MAKAQEWGVANKSSKIAGNVKHIHVTKFAGGEIYTSLCLWIVGIAEAMKCVVPFQ